MNKHTLSRFQKTRRIKVNRICVKLQAMNVKIHNTKTQAIKLLRRLEKSNFIMNGKSLNGIASSIVFYCLPIDTKRTLTMKKYAMMTDTNSVTIHQRISEIRKSIGEIG